MSRWSHQFNLPQKVIHFKCRIPMQENHLVCLVGSGEELGNWNTRDAVILTYDPSTHIWSRKMTLKSPEIYRYRYFVCRPLWDTEPISISNSLKEATGIVIVFWESNIVSRMIHTRVLPENYELPVVDFAVRSYHYAEWTRGWVFDVTEIRLRLCGRQPIQLSCDLKGGSALWVKCVALYFSEMAETSSVPAKLGCAKELIPMCTRLIQACQVSHCSFDPHISGHTGVQDKKCQLKKLSTFTEVLVSKLDGFHCLPGSQEIKGIPYTGKDFINFTLSAAHPETVGFRLELFECNNRKDKLIGYSYILPLVKSHKVLTVPILSPGNSELGVMRLDTLVIMPVPNLHLDMQISYQNHWNWGHPKKSNDLVDLGFSSEPIFKQIAKVSENMLFSLLVAAETNVNYLHFEVQLTKEKIPVLFNDFVAHVTFLNRNNQPEYYKVNVHDLTVDQLSHFKLTKFYKAVNTQSKSTTKYFELIPFPTLATCLATVKKEIGFIIQVKYPEVDTTGNSLIPRYFTEETVVDSIIQIVMEGYDQRKIFFTSTEPDICVLLQKKQNRFPVLFKTKVLNGSQEEVYDFRLSSINAALEFAISEKLLGVYLQSMDVARDKEVITRAQKMGLVVFAGGYGTCNLDIRKLLSRSRVNGMETVHVNFALSPRSPYPLFSITCSEIYTLYVADVVVKKGLMRFPRGSLVEANPDDYNSLVEFNVMDPKQATGVQS